MWRKIIDDYRVQYLNDLFEIKLIFFGLSRMLQFSEFVWALSFRFLTKLDFSYLEDIKDSEMARGRLFSIKKRMENWERLDLRKNSPWIILTQFTMELEKCSSDRNLTELRLWIHESRSPGVVLDLFYELWHFTG